VQKNSYRINLAISKSLPHENGLKRNSLQAIFILVGSLLLARNNLPLNLRQYFAEILKRGPKIAVVTNGKEGVYVAQGNTLLFHPSLPAEVVNTLGAGDAFGSGFVGALLQNLSVEQTLIHGLVQATAVISVLDAQSGLLTADELKKRAAKVSMDLLQHFPL
jgi:sugar/nucleoside kinase (ribokinase family)